LMISHFLSLDLTDFNMNFLKKIYVNNYNS
jgi:hypothetical protein